LQYYNIAYFVQHISDLYLFCFTGSTVIIVVVVIVVMAILTGIIIVGLGMLYLLYKKHVNRMHLLNKVIHDLSCRKKSNEPVLMSNPVVDKGKGDQKFKRM